MRVPKFFLYLNDCNFFYFQYNGTMKIEKNSNVQFHYVIKTADGTVLGSSKDDANEPASYIHGYRLLLPALEDAFTGHEAGDIFDVAVSKDEGFGDYSNDLVFELEADVFQSDKALEVGMEFADEHSGNSLRILELRGDKVLVDANHPFAGKDLVFSVTIEDVNQASDAQIAELMHMLSEHAHGCSCGCHDDNCDCGCGDSHDCDCC